MSVKTALYSHLVADVAVGALAGDRIWQHVAKPKETRPFIVFTRISEPRGHLMRGGDGIPAASFQLDCYAATAAECDTLAEAVRTSLDGFHGAMGSGAKDVRGVFLGSVRDGQDESIGGVAAGIYRTSMDFTIRYGETVPSFP